MEKTCTIIVQMDLFSKVPLAAKWLPVSLCLPQFPLDVRLPGKGNSNSHGAKPVHLIITMIEWIRTNRLLIKNLLSPQTTCRCQGLDHSEWGVGCRRPLSSECGTYKTVKTRFWPWISGHSLQKRSKVIHLRSEAGSQDRFLGLCFSSYTKVYSVIYDSGSVPE